MYKDVNEIVYITRKTIKNIFSNFISHEKIPCDGRDPPWISKKIKNHINEKNTRYLSYIQDGVKMDNHFKFLGHSNYVVICN